MIALITLITTAFSNREISVFFLQSHFQGFLNFSLSFRADEFFLLNVVSQIKITSNGVSGRHNVIKVNVFNEGVNIGSFLNSFFAHSLRNCSGVFLNSSN